MAVSLRLQILVAILLAAPAAGGCRSSHDSEAEPEPEDDFEVVDLRLRSNNDVDVLFVIDNSGSMGEEQANLAVSFEHLLEVLERPDVAANYRIGLTTTDDGNPLCVDTTPEAGTLRMTSCRSRPEEFVFEGAQTIDVTQEACYDACPEAWAEFDTRPSTIAGVAGEASRPWVESIGGRSNLPDGLSAAQALRCAGPQGINGCGFESHLESMWKALNRSTTDTEEGFGFLRDGAVLSIIHVTDEADCSYNPQWETIFLPEGDRIFWPEPGAPVPTSGVCWRAGVACTGSGTYDCSAADLGVTGEEVSPSRAEEDAVLRPLSRYIDSLAEIEANKQRVDPHREVLVAALVGVQSDGSAVYQDSPEQPAFQRDFGIGPGCSTAAGEAVPPVRLRELAEVFQISEQRNLFSICDDDYGPALRSIAEAIAEQMKPTCVPACVADIDPSSDEVDPPCELRQLVPVGAWEFEETIIPACEGDALPEASNVCHQARVGDQRDDYCIDAGFNLEFRLVRREGFPAAPGTEIEATCRLSRSKATDCPELP